MYNLEKLKDRFNFKPRETKHNITAVKLKYIDLKINNERSMSFTDKGDEGNIYNLIDDALGLEDNSPDETPNPNRITLNDVTVKKAMIQIVFRKMPEDRNIPTVMIIISLPGTCNLKDSPLELIAQEYVEKWGFISGEIEASKKNDETTETGKKKSA